MLANGKLQLHRNLNLDNLQATFKNGTEKLAKGNHDEAMTSLDLAVEEINTKVLSTILLRRAAVHESRGNLDLARRDAYSAIAYAKHVADGYIFAYNMHLLQGKCEDAYHVIQEGLKHVPKTDPQYPKLVYLKKNTQADLDNHNAWPLPYHIVTIILDKLDFVDRIHLSSTCMYWQKLLYHGFSGAIWNTVDIDREPVEWDSFVGLFKTGSNKAIRRVHAGTARMTLLMNQVQWKNIEYLEVKHAHISDINLMATISRNKDTLKEISLINVHPIIQEDIERALSEILKSTPNLTRFTFHADAYSEAFRTDYNRPSRLILPPPPIPPLSLTHLSLTELRHLKLVLPYCFNLRSIELLEQDLTGSTPEIFNVVEQHCPNLISFRYGTCKHGIKSPVDELFGNSNPGTRQWTVSSHDSGLREFTYLPGKQVDENVVRTIRKNLATLETLRLNLWVMGASRLYVVHSLAADLHNQLRELELHGRHVEFGSGVTNISENTACQLINVCPNLEALSLNHIDILNDNLYHAVGNHSKLRRLFIRGHISRMPDYDRPLLHRGLAAMFEKTNTLEDFFVESTTSCIDVARYFQAMSAHQGLRRVHLKCSGDMNVNATHMIANVLNRLTYLSLECTRKMTLPEMTFFHLLPRLNWLKLGSGTVISNMTDEIITTLFYKRRENNASSLQISVYEEESYHHDARLYWSETMEKNEKVANKVVFPSTSLIGDNGPSHMETLFHKEKQRVAKAIGTWAGNGWTYAGFPRQANT
ncbi:hypothetical protein BJV82DRAFT_656457 [Fennellomyces sp. T-0311]|nr:hypothetical protein BJV82DRAFT_656457 [Fennellomyces sp. T-0311]